MNVYWYLSRAKLELLADQAPGFLTGIKAQLGFKLPLLSGSLEGTEPARIEGDLQRVIRRLRSENKIVNVADLQHADNPTLISFEGAAVRRIRHNVFWFAMRQGKVGLLLAGSSASAIGTQSKDDASDTLFKNTSADPVGTIRAIFEDPTSPDQIESIQSQTAQDPSESPKPFHQRFVRTTHLGTVSMHLTMAWQELMVEANEGTLPRATGLALFARSVKADARYLNALGVHGKDVERIVVGSPLYVQQI